jgi:hypothetical protein
VALVLPAPASLWAQGKLPPLPDSTGWGVHVLTIARDPRGGLWVGTYGQGILRLRAGTSAWERIRSDTTATSLSWDFVHAFGFGSRGEIWYGTVGNGWGVSTDDGATWTNWTLKQLGPEWQYVAPNGIATRGDTVWIGTADGIQVTSDGGQHWIALGDKTGPAAKGPADTAYAILNNEYVKRLGVDRRGVVITTPKGNELVTSSTEGWASQALPTAAFAPEPRRDRRAGRARRAGSGSRPIRCPATAPPNPPMHRAPC